MDNRCLTQCPEIVARQCGINALSQQKQNMLATAAYTTISYDTEVATGLNNLPDDVAEEYAAGLTAIATMRWEAAGQGVEEIDGMIEVKAGNIGHIASACEAGPQPTNRLFQKFGGQAFKCASSVVAETSKRYRK